MSQACPCSLAKKPCDWHTIIADGASNQVIQVLPRLGRWPHLSWPTSLLACRSKSEDLATKTPASRDTLSCVQTMQHLMSAQRTEHSESMSVQGARKVCSHRSRHSWKEHGVWRAGSCTVQWQTTTTSIKSVTWKPLGSRINQLLPVHGLTPITLTSMLMLEKHAERNPDGHHTSF